MAQTLVRDIPDEAFDRFKRKAKEQGKSTEGLLREIIVREAGPSRHELVEELLERARANDAFRREKGLPPIDVVALIREGRDNDWRDDESRGRLDSDSVVSDGSRERKSA